MTNLLLALLIFPGLLLALGLAVGFQLLVSGSMRPGRFSGAAFTSAEGIAGAISILLAALALALLPWPLHPASNWTLIGSPLALWLALEGAYIAPLLAALPAQHPLVTRAAIREAQIGTAGRCVIWLAAGSMLWRSGAWSAAALPGQLLLLISGLLALPAAAGIGPFGAERSLTAAGAEQGLDESTAGLLRFARTARAASLLAALLIAAVPRQQIQASVALLVATAGFVVVALILRRSAGALPRFTLPAALHWCWWRALPPAIIGLVYLLII